MRTQIISLDLHDDLISIRDKMSWAKTPRILLVWPGEGHVDVRPLDLQLLRRHASSLGAELGLVTKNSEIRAAARRMNLPVFSSAGKAQRKPWPPRAPVRPERRFPRLDLRTIRDRLPRPELFDISRQPDARLIVFAVGVLAVLIVVLFFVPSAEIRMTAPTRQQTVTIAVSAETDAPQISLSGVIPARELIFNLEETDSVLSSGHTVSPDQTAEGEVRFTNLVAAAVEVPKGTVVLTRSNPPVGFATVGTAQIPVGKGSTVSIHVRALVPGSSGNVSADSILAFEGPLGLSVGVTNPVATTGGTDVTAALATDADRLALHDRLLTNIKAHAKSQLSSHLQTGDVLFPVTFNVSKVLAETYTPGPNQPGDKLTLTLRAEFHAYYAAAADLNQLATRVMNASLPAGYDPLDDTLKVKPFTALADNPDGNARWRIQASRTLRARIDPARVIYLVQGKTAWHAGSLLQETFALESAPQISIQPFFWPWLPSLPFRITVAG
jgi:hypothetical protein